MSRPLADLQDLVVRLGDKYIIRDGDQWKTHRDAQLKFASAVRVLASAGFDADQVANALDSVPTVKGFVWQYLAPSYVTNSDGFVYRNVYTPSRVVPVKGEYPTISRLLRYFVANNAEHYEYLMHWSAALAYTDTVPGTAVVICSPRQGVGKDVLGDILGLLVGTRNVFKETPRSLMSGFNSTSANARLVRVEELAIQDKHHSASSQLNNLKAMITGNWVRSEAKGQDATMVQSKRMFFITSNTTYVINIEEGDRRFSIFTPNSNEPPPFDRVYFDRWINGVRSADGPDHTTSVLDNARGPIRDEIAAFAWDLKEIARNLNYSLISFAPETETKHEIRSVSISSIDAFVEDIGSRGLYDILDEYYPEHTLDRTFFSRLSPSVKATEFFKTNGCVPSSELYRCFVQYCKDEGRGGVYGRRKFAARLKELQPPWYHGVARFQRYGANCQVFWLSDPKKHIQRGTEDGSPAPDESLPEAQA